MARATTRQSDTAAPAPSAPTFATIAQREREAREAALEQSRQGFEAEMAASERDMVEQIRAESRDYRAEDMEPGDDVGFDDVDMSDIPSPDIYGVQAWSRERERRLSEQIGDSIAAEIRRDMMSQRPPSPGIPESYAPSGDTAGDDGELWGEDLIAEALRAEGRR